MKKGIKTAAQTAILMAILTLVSKCFGFVREMVMANYYGATYVTDAYVMSTTILSVLFGGLIAAISTAYIPIFSTINEKDGEIVGNRFTSSVINLMLIVTVMISFIGILFSDQIISIFASGFSGETAKLASFFVKVLFSYVIFSSITGILESYLQYKGTFLPQIISGYVISICTIIAIIISTYTSYYYLAYGILAGYFLLCTMMVIIAKRRGYKYSITFIRDENVKEIISLAIPTFIGSYIIFINQFIDKTLASNLVEGSISALNYASLINNMIMSITVTILATIIYPKLTKANSLEQYDKFNDIISTGLNIVVIIALPCSLGAMVYSSQVVQIVYERGAFGSVATLMTSSAFFYYVSGLLFMSINSLLTKVYYSIHDMKTPMIFAGIGVIINIVLNLILIQFMAHSGLALATSIAALCNTIMLYLSLRRKHPNIHIFKSRSKLLKIAIAAFISVGVSYIVYLFVIMPLSHIIVARLAQLLFAVAVAGLVYLGLLIALKVDEVKLISQIIRK